MKHNISCEYPGVKVTAYLKGKVVAMTTSPMLMKEDGGLGYDPVFYFPLADVNMEFLTPSSTRSNCYLKGEARYWTLNATGHPIVDAAWDYHIPIPGMEMIKDHIAFYTKQITIDVISEADNNAIK